MAEKRAVANLDILRAVAVLMVVLDHVCESISRNVGHFFHPWDWALGRLGVLLFFVHTSLVLHRSMDRLHMHGFALMKGFLIRRAFRIFPLSTICVLFVVTMQVPTMPWEDFEWRGVGNLLSNLLLSTNLTFSRPVLGPLWSLPLEVQMYCLLPIVYMLVCRWNGIATAIILWIISLPLAFWQPTISDRGSVIGFAPCFLGGVIAFAMERDSVAALHAKWWIPFLAGLVAMYLSVQMISGDMFFRPAQWVVCAVLGVSMPLFKDCTNPIIVGGASKVAKYSYGIYLFHCIALWGASKTLGNWPITVQIAFASCMLIGTTVVLHLIIETPAIQMGARVADRLTKRRSLTHQDIPRNCLVGVKAEKVSEQREGVRMFSDSP